MRWSQSEKAESNSGFAPSRCVSRGEGNRGRSPAAKSVEFPLSGLDNRCFAPQNRENVALVLRPQQSALPYVFNSQNSQDSITSAITKKPRGTHWVPLGFLVEAKHHLSMTQFLANYSILPIIHGFVSLQKRREKR